MRKKKCVCQVGISQCLVKVFTSPDMSSSLLGGNMIIRNRFVYSPGISVSLSSPGTDQGEVSFDRHMGWSLLMLECFAQGPSFRLHSVDPFFINDRDRICGCVPVTSIHGQNCIDGDECFTAAAHRGWWCSVPYCKWCVRVGFLGLI